MAKIRDYYDFVSTNLWACTLCDKQLKSTTTSNLITHFRQKHEEEYADFLKISWRAKKDEDNLERFKKKRKFVPIPLTDDPPASQSEHTTIDRLDEVNGEIVTEFDWQGAEEDTAEQYADESNTKYVNVSTSSNFDRELEAEDPLKLFFLTMYASAKRLPREDLFQLRRRIFDLVSEAEEQSHYKTIVDEQGMKTVEVVEEEGMKH